MEIDCFDNSWLKILTNCSIVERNFCNLQHVTWQISNIINSLLYFVTLWFFPSNDHTQMNRV